MGPPVVAKEEDDSGGCSHGDPTRVPSSSSSPSPSSSTPSATERIRLDLRRCSAGDLAAALVEQRGREEANRILLEATEIVNGAATNGSSTSKHTIERGDGTATAAATANTATAATDNLGQALLVEPAETSLLSPRLGRFKLELYEGGLVATKVGDDSVRLVLSAETVGHVLVFPKPEDCRAIVANGRRDNGDDGGGSSSKKMKTNGSLVLLSLRLPVTTVQNRQTNELCFSLPWDKKLGPTFPRVVTETDGSGSDGEDPTVAWFRVLQQALGGSSNRRDGRSVGPVFVHVQPGLPSGFQSYQPPGTSTTTGGMPFVSCYHGVNDGALYPLKEGLLFFKPPTFLPRSALHSIACGRGSSGGGGGGQSSSRYVDMVVQVRDITTTTGGGGGKGDGKDPRTVEFTNIQREELGPLNEYIRDVLIPAMKEDADRGTVPTSKDGKGHARPATDGDGGGEGSDTDNDDDDDEDAMEAEAVDDQEDDVDEAESDEDDEDFHVDDDDDDDDGEDEEDDDDDDDDGDHVFGKGQDDEFTVVKDEFAMKLAKEKRKMKGSGEESTTESEEEDTSRPRSSKRLRRGG